MLQFADDKYLHSANVLMCVGGLVTATGVIAVGGAAVGAMMSLKEVMRRLPPEAKPMAQDIANRLRRAVEDDPGLSDDARALIPQMIVVSAPAGETIIACGRDAARVLQAMRNTLTAMRDQPEYGQERHLGPFERIVGPILTDLLNNPAISAQLSPHMDRAMLAMRDAVGDTSDRVKGVDAKVEALQVQMAAMLAALAPGGAGIAQIPLADLRELAKVFGADPALGHTALFAFLTDKARDIDRLSKQVAALTGQSAGIDNIRVEAAQAIALGRLDDARRLLDDAREIRRDQRRKQLEADAALSEVTAEIDLIEGKATAAHALLSACADSFAAVDPLECARRRRRYGEQLYNHGLRYGGPGLTLAFRLFDRLLQDLPPDADPLLRSAGHNGRAITLDAQGSRTAGPDGAALLTRAVADYTQALTIFTRADNPVDWAKTLQNRAGTLDSQGNRTAGPTGAALLERAIQDYTQALTIFTRTKHPVLWAGTLHNRAIALRARGSRMAGPTGEALLKRAVQDATKALLVRTAAEHPVQWARTLQNRGGALQAQGSRAAVQDGAALFARAIQDYTQALTVITPADHPVEWVMALGTRAGALEALGSRTPGPEGVVLLAEAVQDCTQALTVCTTADRPIDWAATLQNRANALWAQGSRTPGPDGAALLNRAVQDNTQAMTVFTLADHPLDWAMIRENLALLEQARAGHDTCTDPGPHLRAALEHVEAALTVYGPDHMPHDHETATTLRTQILAALTSDP